MLELYPFSLLFPSLRSKKFHPLKIGFLTLFVFHDKAIFNGLFSLRYQFTFTSVHLPLILVVLILILLYPSDLAPKSLLSLPQSLLLHLIEVFIFLLELSLQLLLLVWVKLLLQQVWLPLHQNLQDYRKFRYISFKYQQ